MSVEVLLKPLVRKVDAKLLERVVQKALKAKHIENANPVQGRVLGV